MSYLARAGTLADLQVGREILYFAGGEYTPGTVYHGIITARFDEQGSGEAQYVPIALDSSRLPVRIFGTRPLWIVGS